MVAKLDPGKSLVESLADGTGEYWVQTEEDIYRKGLKNTEWVKVEEKEGD